MKRVLASKCEDCSIVFFKKYSQIVRCRRECRVSPADCRATRTYVSFERRFLKECGIPERLLSHLYACAYKETDTLQFAIEKMRDLIYRKRWFMLIGEPGLGKSFAAAWMLRAFMRSQLAIEYIEHLKGGFYWIPARRIDTFIRTPDVQVDFYERVKNATLVVVDDLGDESPDEKRNWKTRYIAYLIEERYDANKPVIFTTNLQITPSVKEEIISSLYGERVYSRLCEVCTFKTFYGEDLRKEGL
jgi:DNA replication protein DnaC